MNSFTLGIILAIIASSILIYLAFKARQLETSGDKSAIDSIDIPDLVDPTVQKKWNINETIIAFFLSTYGNESLGPFIRIAVLMKRTPSSLSIKVEIFDDLSNGNITKNATKLDREVFENYKLISRSTFYSVAVNAITNLA